MRLLKERICILLSKRLGFGLINTGEFYFEFYICIYFGYTIKINKNLCRKSGCWGELSLHKGYLTFRLS